MSEWNSLYALHKDFQLRIYITNFTVSFNCGPITFVFPEVSPMHLFDDIKQLMKVWKLWLTREQNEVWYFYDSVMT